MDRIASNRNSTDALNLTAFGVAPSPCRPSALPASPDRSAFTVAPAPIADLPSTNSGPPAATAGASVNFNPVADDVRSLTLRRSSGALASPARTPLPLGEGQGEGCPVGALASPARTTLHSQLSTLNSEKICRDFTALRAAGYSANQAARALGKSPSWFSGPNSPFQRWLREGAAALAPAPRDTTKLQRFAFPDWAIAAARFFYLLTNRTADSGSVPEAIRRTISLPICPPLLVERLKKVLAPHLPSSRRGNESPTGACASPLPLGEELATPESVKAGQGEGFSVDPDSGLPIFPPTIRETILARQAAGQPLVPERIARQITSAAVTVRTRRNRKNADLDFYNGGPGSLMWYTDPVSGARRFIRAGDAFEADDATINFPVCVPWEIGGDPCSDKFGVRVGRFQWLVAIDRASRFVLPYSYTARPRSSYRGEDVLALIRLIARAHGLPATWVFEQGVWKSNLVKDAIKNMGCQLQTVYSPHSKAFIEGLFNVLWTKLSVWFPDAHVGRYAGDEKEAADLLVACKRGHKDPRRYFPQLGSAVAAFDASINEKNATEVHSEHYGSWLPKARWAEQLAAHPLRQLGADSAWLFSPWVREWTIKGMSVGGRICLFEDLSVPFDFSAPWLQFYHGARVKCYFDPQQPKCQATVVLAEAWPGGPQGDRPGAVLGTAEQINDVAGYARLVMGWGDDPIGRARYQKQQSAKAVRRVLRDATGKLRISEAHDGIATTTTVEREAGAGNHELSTTNQEPRTCSADPYDLDPARIARANQLLQENPLDWL